MVCVGTRCVPCVCGAHTSYQSITQRPTRRVLASCCSCSYHLIFKFAIFESNTQTMHKHRLTRQSYGYVRLPVSSGDRFSPDHDWSTRVSRDSETLCTQRALADRGPASISYMYASSLLCRSVAPLLVCVTCAWRWWQRARRPHRPLGGARKLPRPLLLLRGRRRRRHRRR